MCLLKNNGPLKKHSYKCVSCAEDPISIRPISENNRNQVSAVSRNNDKKWK